MYSWHRHTLIPFPLRQHNHAHQTLIRTLPQIRSLKRATPGAASKGFCHPQPALTEVTPEMICNVGDPADEFRSPGTDLGAKKLGTSQSYRNNFVVLWFLFCLNCLFLGRGVGGGCGCGWVPLAFKGQQPKALKDLPNTLMSRPRACESPSKRNIP